MEMPAAATEGDGPWGDYPGAAAAAAEVSASATLVHFDRPLPLLRVPLPAGASDDPSTGPFVLAFPSADHWRATFRSTEAKVVEQCEAGARVGCSLSASKKCRTSWWKTLFGAGGMDFAERERCEEREMLACLKASKEPCIQFAKEKCLPPFRDARIASTNLSGFPHLQCSQSCNESEAKNVKPEDSCSYVDVSNNLQATNHEQTNYSASILLENFFMEKSRRGSSEF